jgi:hypothetical protein
VTGQRHGTSADEVIDTSRISRKAVLQALALCVRLGEYRGQIILVRKAFIMKSSIWVMAAAAAALAGCTDMQTQKNITESGFIRELPEGVVTLAASYQNLNAVRIDPATGCYEYEYRGPVETTFLPLRSDAGNPICSRPQDVAAVTG